MVAESIPIPAIDPATDYIPGAGSLEISQQQQQEENSEGQLNADADDSSDAPADAPADADAEEALEQQEQAAQTIVEQAGLNFQELASEYTQLGGLSESSYAKLEAAGIPRELVDGYIEGQTARADKVREEILSSVTGGEAAVAAMVTWASSNLAPAEIEAFNSSLRRDKDSAILALTGLQARYEAVNGRNPKLLQGENSTGGGGAFSNRSEIVEAMKDPRYKKDAKYRQSVIDRIKRSPRTV